MSSRNLNDAIYQMKIFAMELIKRAGEELRLKVIVVSVMRTYLEQVALHAQGRLPLYEVNLARKKAGMLPIEAHLNNIVTWTLNSKHIINLDDNFPENDKSKAVDFGILDKYGKYQGSDKADVNKDNEPDYIQLGELGVKLAGEFDYPIRWGGHFKKSKDYPHFEWMF